LFAALVWLIGQIGTAQANPSRTVSVRYGKLIRPSMQTSSTRSPLPHYYQPHRSTPTRETVKVDVCVYGGTAGGVAAAVQSSRLGRSVLLLENGAHLGGMTTGGLSYTDFGNKAAIGGIAREFYRGLGAHYEAPEEWTFEPHVAQEVIDGMVAKAGAPVRYHEFLKSVMRDGRRIRSIRMESGLTVEARIFIDATYEGDLMAKAGVTYHVGRESNSLYNETLNGVQVRNLHQFEHPVDPYKVEGDPSSGLLPGIDPSPLEPEGTGDRRVQAYNFRLCLTQDPENRIPFPKPAGYDRRQYTLLERYLAAGWNGVFGKFDPIRGKKVDKNNHGATSTDFIGMSWDYPEADYRKREKIYQEHLRYQMGWFYFLANDKSVPETVRTRMSSWGLCKDEFQDTGGWPAQLYIREARRMVSDVVMTESHCRGRDVVEDSVGLASYTMDSHNCRRFLKDGKVMNEGDVQAGGLPPYPVSYRSIVPRRGECDNLIVPICLSASHIAYGSIRMEPVFMVLGQSGAFAADLAIREDRAVQDVAYTELRPLLEQASLVLVWPNVTKSGFYREPYLEGTGVTQEAIASTATTPASK
jgi:hypothetical protein